MQNALSGFGRAWYQQAAIRMFRDETNLSVSPGLWSSIEKALDESAWFLLLCSPEAGKSKWVSREIEYWVSHSTAHKLLIVLTGGEVVWSNEVGDFDWQRTTLPASLSRVYTQEPLWADMRWVQSEEHLSLHNPRFRDQIADILSSVTGRPKDALIGEDVRVQRRALRVAWLASTILFVLLVVSVLAAVEAVRERYTAVAQTRIAVGRQLGAQAELTRSLQGRLIERSVLLAIESACRVNSIETDQALRNGLMLLADPGLKIPHTHPVEALAISPDGDKLAAVDEKDKTATIFRASTAVLGTVAHDDWLKSAAFSPDGRLPVTASWDQTLRIWDSADVKELVRLPHPGIVEDVAFSQDGRCLASGSGAKSAGPGKNSRQQGWLRVWAIASGAPPSLREVTNVVLGGDAANIAFDPQARYIAATCFGTVPVFRNPGGREEWRAEEESAVEEIAFSPDGKYLACGVFDGYAYLYDFQTRRLAGTFGGRGDGVRRVAFTPDSAHLITGGSDDTVRAWNIETGGELRRISAASRLAVTPDGRRIVTANGSAITFWDWSSDPVLRTIKHPTSLLDLALPQDSHRLAALDAQHVLWPSDPLAGKPPKKTEYPETDSALSLSSDGTRIVVAHQSAVTIESSDATRKVYATLPHPPAVESSPPTRGDRRSVRRAAFSPDRRRLVTVGFDNTVRLWNTENWALDRSFQVEMINDVLFSEDARRLLVSAAHRPPERGKGVLRVLSVWEAGTAERLAEAQLPAFLGTSIETAISRRGAYFAAAAKRVRSFPHEEWVRDVRFDATGKYLATASGDNTFRVWELASGREVARMVQDDDIVEARFSPDGRYIVNKSIGAAISLWPLARFGFGSRSVPFDGVVPKKEEAALRQDQSPDQPDCYSLVYPVLERLQKRDHLLLLFVGQVPEVVNYMCSLIPVTRNRAF